MSRHPLEELLDAWMDMMEVTRPKIPRFMLPSVEDKEHIGDWEDRNGEIAVTIDMPGVDKKDIELMVDTHTVSVTAITDIRDYDIHREFTQTLNPSKVIAKFNNGVLDIKIEKADASKGKKVTIK